MSIFGKGKKKTRRALAAYHTLHMQALAQHSARLDKLLEAVQKLLERPGPDFKTYEHTPDNRGEVKLVPRASAFSVGFEQAASDANGSGRAQQGGQS